MFICSNNEECSRIGETGGQVVRKKSRHCFMSPASETGRKLKMRPDSQSGNRDEWIAPPLQYYLFTGSSLRCTTPTWPQDVLGVFTATICANLFFQGFELKLKSIQISNKGCSSKSLPGTKIKKQQNNSQTRVEKPNIQGDNVFRRRDTKTTAAHHESSVKNHFNCMRFSLTKKMKSDGNTFIHGMNILSKARG